MNRSPSLRIRIALSWSLYMPVVGIAYLIAWLDRQVKFPLPFPRDVEQLSERKPWLIDQLRHEAILPADAVIDSCEVAPLDPNIIFRSNAAIVTIGYTHMGTPLVFKCFAKFAPTMGTIWNKTIFNLQLNHIKEAWFNQYFVNQDPAIAAPRVYCSKVSAITGNLCLVTEHMGDDIEYRESAYQSFSQQHLDMAIDGLASLHAACWGDQSARMKRILPISDMAVYMFDSMVSGSWSMPARAVLVKSWTLMNRPQTVLHGDSRIGNMMFPSAPGCGRYVLIDWQATRAGTGAFDLAYFLILSLISYHRQAVEQSAVDTYHRLLLAKGVKDYSREQLEEDYRHGCLCTLVVLSLPLLSGEVSAEGLAAQVFVYGMGVWRERMRIHFQDFDYRWMADCYGLTEQQSRDAVAEMLEVIRQRLYDISEAAGTHEPLVDLLKRNNMPYQFDV
jgi:hypothetical protein